MGSRYGAMCPQLVAGEVKGDEDCLYINVWRLQEKPNRPLPVMVWLTGGGNHSFSGEGSGGLWRRCLQRPASHVRGCCIRLLQSSPRRIGFPRTQRARQRTAGKSLRQLRQPRPDRDAAMDQAQYCRVRRRSVAGVSVRHVRGRRQHLRADHVAAHPRTHSWRRHAEQRSLGCEIPTLADAQERDRATRGQRARMR